MRPLSLLAKVPAIRPIIHRLQLMDICTIDYGFDRRDMMANEINTDKWINIDEAAEYMGIRPGTIRDWIRKEKGIPAHKIGKQWKFKCSELDKWVKSGESAIN